MTNDEIIRMAREARLEAARQRLECINQYVNDEVFEQLRVAV